MTAAPMPRRRRGIALLALLVLAVRLLGPSPHAPAAASAAFGPAASAIADTGHDIHAGHAGRDVHAGHADTADAGGHPGSDRGHDVPCHFCRLDGAALPAPTASPLLVEPLPRAGPPPVRSDDAPPRDFATIALPRGPPTPIGTVLPS